MISRARLGTWSSSALLADSQQVRQCITEKLNSYAFGQRPWVEDSCVSNQVEAATATTGPKLIDLFKGITSSPAFRNRNGSN